MGVHPDLTAYRAVDACGGTYSREQAESGFAAGHKAALDEACKAVAKADALTAELLAALRDLDAVLGQTPMPDCATLNRLIAASSKARAAIAKAEAQPLAADTRSVKGG